jgi:hypothetical protein
MAVYWEQHFCLGWKFFPVLLTHNHPRTSHHLSAEKNFWTQSFSLLRHNPGNFAGDHPQSAAALHELFHMLDIHTHKQAFPITP